jgi:ectoine hydroxylase-related dioxygenase (phytanoyl-CoA dioxygenase family)
MSASITHLHASDPIELVCKALHADGAVIVEDLLDADTLARLNAELDPLLAAPVTPRPFLNAALQDFFGANTRHLTGVAAKSRVFATEVMVNPTLLGVCDEILLPACSSYQLNLGHVLDRGPGSAAQFPHRDELVWIHLPDPHPTVQLASMIALVDFTADNGATVIVPGSHHGHGHERADGDPVAAEMPAGSAVIYLGATLHGAGTNHTSDQWRRGLHLSYVVGWLRTEENHYLTTWPDVVRTLPELSQQLLGYGAHDAINLAGGYLGAVELQDPVQLMANGEL